MAFVERSLRACLLIACAGTRDQVLIAIAFLALLAPVLSNTLVVTACAWFLFEMCVGVSFPTYACV